MTFLSNGGYKGLTRDYNRVIRILRAMGVTEDRDSDVRYWTSASNVSGSRYVYVQQDLYNDDDQWVRTYTAKVRFSGHDLPERYAAAEDLDLVVWVWEAARVDVAIERIAALMGLEIPKRYCRSVAPK